MKLEKQFNYVYIITNLINEKQYIGEHSTNNLNDRYLGSGKYLIKAIKKYGKGNFKKEILEQFNTKEEAFNAQEKYINEYNTIIPNGYNISPHGGRGMKGACKSRHLSIAHKQKISVALKGKPLSEEHKKNLMGKNKGKKHSYEQNINHSLKISGVNNVNWGKKLSESTKEKISKAHKGKKLSTEHKEKISKNKKNNQYAKGHFVSENTKQMLSTLYKNKTFEERYGEEKAKLIKLKLSNSLYGHHNNLNHKLTIEHKEKISNSLKGEKNHFYGKKHSEKSKLQMSKSRKGKILSEEHKNNIKKGLEKRKLKLNI
jgi:hypothetical protein